MMTTEASSQNCRGEPTPATRTPFERWRRLLPVTLQDTRGHTVICRDNLGNFNTHGEEQRYVSSTTGVCRELVIQAVHPNLKVSNERPISDHAGHVSKLALWLMSTNPFHHGNFYKWVGTWLLFEVKLLWYLLWGFVQLLAQLHGIDLPDDWTDGSEPYDTGFYKPYVRDFSGQLWEARSKMEHSTRLNGKKERGIETHSLYPRLIVIHDPSRDEWVPCTEPSTIKRKKYLTISYRAADVYTPGLDEESEKERFKQEVRLAALQQNFDAYWLDLECIGETQDDKNLDVYCMADVYRGAESTLIMLGNASEGEEAAWERWGGRVWTFPEALLSQRLLYKYRDRDEINPITLHQLANLAYPKHASEQAVINAYSGKDPLERLERLSRLKSAIWDPVRDIRVADTPPLMPTDSVPPPPSTGGSAIKKAPPEAHRAERVYALMGFFDHRIHPNYAEDELRALARLSIANDSDRIAERMLSLLPFKPHPDACWYADEDIYGANLWDILPEIQVAGVTKSGALVVDGCRAACIRWRDFPTVVSVKTNSVRRTVLGFMPYLAWPILIIGIATLRAAISVNGGIVLVVIGIVLLLVSPRIFVFSEAGRVVASQPWFIGVKGVLHKDTAAEHLYGGGNNARHRRLGYTPSGSQFAVPDREGTIRGPSDEQYDQAKKKEDHGTRMYTLIDTYAGAVYYFTAERPPTVCLFTGREGGLGRFVLCSERCHLGELHKETVLRMPTHVSQRMEMCGWIALG